MSAPRPQPSGSAVGFKQRLHHPFETPFVSDPAELGASRPPRVAGDAFEQVKATKKFSAKINVFAA